MSERNLEIWDKVEKTDPQYTKLVNQRGGYTSICATYQSMRATEVFGPYGEGWGLSEIKYDYALLESTKMVLCHAVFFYITDCKRVEFPLSNAIMPMMGAKADEDFLKKVETNTISKALSRLGFSADVFMGLFDNTDYVNQLKTESEIDRAEDREAEIVNKRKDMGEYLAAQFATIEASKSFREVSAINKALIRHLERQKAIPAIADICAAGLIKLARLVESKKTELGVKNDSAA